MDAATISLPIFTALSCVGCAVTVLVWVYTTFDQKSDAIARDVVLTEKLIAQEILLREVSKDVSFIRGRLEGKFTAHGKT